MLSERFPDLRALEALVTVARTGSLNTAAAELGRTQQALSARIAALETRTGVGLVTRGPRGATLTPAGVAVVEWGSRLLEQAAEVDAGLAALRGDRRSRLRVAASLTVAERLLPAWLVDLDRRARQGGAPPPRPELQTTNSTAVVRLVRAGEVDLGFVEGPRPPRGLRSRTIAHDRLVVVVPPGHPWAARRRPLTAGELAHTALVTRERGSGTRDTLAAALAAADEDPDAAAPVAQLSTTAAVRTAVLAGAGPSVLSDLVVADDLAAGRLVAVPVEGLDLRRSLRAVWREGRTPPAGPARDLVALAARA